MDKKRIFFFICFLVCALIFYTVIRTIIEGEKGKVKQVIFAASSAIEQEDLVRLSNFVSFDYHDQYGNDRQSLLFFAQIVFNEYQDIALQFRKLEIELKESDTLALMEVVGWGRRTQEAQIDSPLEYDIIRLKVNFKKEQNSWKVIELEFLEPQKFKFIPLA